MTTTTPSDSIPEIVSDGLIWNPMGPPERDGRLTHTRFRFILLELFLTDDPDEKLLALRKFCDDFGLHYTAMFAMLATWAPGLLSS